MTDAELQGIAAQALNMAKLDLERGSFNFLLATHHGAKEGLHRMRKVEAMVIKTLGENWLNAGRTKDLGFRLFRMATDRMPPDAVVFATASNQFDPTEKLLASPELVQKVNAAKSHDEHWEFVRQGLLAVHDALVCVAQTSERVCQYVHRYDPKLRQFIDAPKVMFIDQAHFGGRLKMYGKERELP